jgi:uncharacterized protein
MLEEKVLKDYMEAMKAKDSLKSSVLSFLRAELKYVSTAKNVKALDDADVIPVIKKQIKQRQDSIEAFTKGERPELAQKEARELEVLKAYLPPEMGEEELRALVKEAVASTGAIGPRDMGKVMKEVNAKVQGRADGKTVSDLVRQVLSGGA